MPVADVNSLHFRGQRLPGDGAGAHRLGIAVVAQDRDSFQQ